MKILFLGDIVGTSGCEAVKKFLPKKIEENKIVGGYYPVNYEIDDLDILGRLEKKKITISLP